MIPISELKYVEKILFESEVIYYKPELYRFILQNFTEDNEIEESTLNKIEKIKEQTSDQLAHNVLLNKDIQTIRKNFKKKDLKFDDVFWIDALPKIKKKIEKHLGLKFKSREINFVDKFPKGHESFEVKGASAITIFEGNEGAGIYFINKRIDLVSTAIHIIHEQIHTCLSQNKDKDQMFMEWFEEGLAIYYSLKIYFEITNDLDAIKSYKIRSYLNNKVKPEWDFTKRYFEYMKIFSMVFVQGGDEKIQKLLKAYIGKKRDTINNELINIQNSEIQIKYAPKDKFESFIFSFGIVVDPEIITPLEYRILEVLQKKPLPIPELSKEISAPEEITKKSLNNLFGKGICLMVRDNKIDINWRKKDLFDKGLLKPMLPLK